MDTLFRYDGNETITMFNVEKNEDLNSFKILEEVSFPELKPKSDLVEIGEFVKVFCQGNPLGRLSDRLEKTTCF